MSVHDEIRRWFWKMDVYSYSQPFPRDLGKLRYPQARCWKDYLMYILNSIWEKTDAYVAFYSDEDIRTKVNKIFIDIDVSNGLETLWENLVPFIKFFWKNLLVFFSGKKGFHIIVFIEPISFDELCEHKNRIYQVLSTWCQAYIDSQTFLDKRRIYRITFTYHTKGGRWKIPVYHKWDISKILSLSENLNVTEFIPCMKSIVPLDYKIFLKEPYEVIEQQFTQ